jgi:hypothetical protein
MDILIQQVLKTLNIVCVPIAIAAPSSRYEFVVCMYCGWNTQVVLWPFFHKYDESRRGVLDIVELAAAFR